ncbi:MAG: DUF5107 domain-containing protein [Verrucomicrobia bacterium]|nr:DUF5107 domain-containing protein [Verrucomicrobiota bacterium]
MSDIPAAGALTQQNSNDSMGKIRGNCGIGRVTDSAIRPIIRTETGSLRVETYPWLAAPLGGDNPQPVFRDLLSDMAVAAHESLPPEISATIGRGCGRRVLPYRMQDRYGRERQVREFQSIVLENETLKATFLPELGGRLISLFHMPTQRELLFRNPVFQPANLALRDAWFAGGIEWNISQFGHAFHTCAPVFAAAIPGLDGSRGLRLYDFERCKGLLWQIDFHLPPGAKFLYAFTRVVNPRDEETAMYWWTNVAVPESPDVRVLAPADTAVYVIYDDTGLCYGQTNLPGLPTLDGDDGTYPKNNTSINEFFLQCDRADGMPWQAALDGRGTGFVEASTQRLNVRKQFCWGMHQGGHHWKEFLSVPDQPYFEIQAGLAPTQQHTVPMPGGAHWHWTQVFGYLEADATKVHGADWQAAWQTADAALRQQVTPASLSRIDAACAANADAAPVAILSFGSGWGALEAKRRAARDEAVFPAAFAFPVSTLGSEQQRWLSLLETGAFPTQSTFLPPGEWMIQPEWMEMLARAAAPDWFAMLHLGVMKMEHGDEPGALAAWEESIRLRPSAWAWRNLGAAAVRHGDAAGALPHYQQAWGLALGTGTPDISFALEYLAALHAAGEHAQAWAFHQSLPGAMRLTDTVRLLAARVALARDDLSFVEAALKCDYASIREGARDMTDLWFGLQAKRLSAETGRPVDAAMLEQLKTSNPLPARIDFRIIK